MRARPLAEGDTACRCQQETCKQYLTSIHEENFELIKIKSGHSRSQIKHKTGVCVVAPIAQKGESSRKFCISLLPDRLQFGRSRTIV